MKKFNVLLNAFMLMGLLQNIHADNSIPERNKLKNRTELSNGKANSQKINLISNELQLSTGDTTVYSKTNVSGDPIALSSNRPRGGIFISVGGIILILIILIILF